MSENAKTLTKVILVKQIKDAEDIIAKAQRDISVLQMQLQQAAGVAVLARHIMREYDLPDGAPELTEAK